MPIALSKPSIGRIKILHVGAYINLMSGIQMVETSSVSFQAMICTPDILPFEYYAISIIQTPAV